MATAPFLHLHTLGCLELRRPDGTPAGDGAQPKPLALLAFLAATPKDGFLRRDRLVALFWPELDQAHARAALRKALHHLRDLDARLILTRGEEVRVDPNVLWCDAREFRRLAASGTYAEALELYAGEFLTGLYIADAPEFDQWLDRERHRLRELAMECAFTLATGAALNGGSVAAVRWATRATEMAPLSERPNRLLIEVLDASGDRPAAVAAYERYCERLSRELELPPSDDLVRLVERIRQGTSITTPTNCTEATSTDIRGKTDSVRLVPRRTPHRAVAIIGLLTIATAIAALSTRSAIWKPSSTYVPDRVLVLPLQSTDRSQGLAAFGLNIATTLTNVISQEGVGVPVPAARVRDVLSGNGAESTDLAGRLARRTGAGLVLWGACSPKTDHTECHLELLRMPGSVPRLSLTAAGDPADPRFSAELIERAAAILLLQQRWQDRTSWLGEYIPRSLEAVREFNEAFELWVIADTNANGHFKRAAVLDTAWLLPAAFYASSRPWPEKGSIIDQLGERPGLRQSERDLVASFQAWFNDDFERAYQLTSRLFATQPEIWLDDMATLANWTYRPEAVLKAFKIADSVTAIRPRVYLEAAYALHHLGRYAEEVKLAARLRERFPQSAIPYRTVEIMGQAALGNLDAVRRVVAEAEATPEKEGNTAGTRTWIAGLEFLAHGRHNEGRELMMAAVPILQRLRKENSSTGYSTYLGRAEIIALVILGRIEEAGTLALQDLPKQTTMGDSAYFLGLLGQVAALRGDKEQALRYSTQLMGLDRPYSGGWPAINRARIAARLGDRVGAVRLLEAARSVASHFGLAYWELHRDPAFASLRGYPPFEQFIRSKG